MTTHPVTLLPVALTLSSVLLAPALPGYCADKYLSAKDLLVKKQFKKSLAESERLIQADPNDEQAHLLHVDALHSLGHEGDPRRIKEANAELNKVIKRNPNSSSAYAKRAKTYLAFFQPADTCCGIADQRRRNLT